MMGMFDTALCLNVLEGLPDPAIALRVSRRLRPGKLWCWAAKGVTVCSVDGRWGIAALRPRALESLRQEPASSNPRASD